jgi:uncharacterized protein (TIGR03435 family)
VAHGRGIQGTLLRRSGKLVFRLLLTGTLSLNGLAQAPPQGGTASLFEAISIRESTGTRIPVQWQGARFMAGEIPLSTLLVAAYQIPFYQVSELPDWVRTVRYEINALATRAPSPAEQPALLRALLEERFRIVARTETQERPIYALVMARPDGRLGAGLKSSAVDCGAILTARAAGKIVGDASPQCRVAILAGSYVRDGIPLALLADTISTRLQRPVVDRTGLTGFFDVELRFRPPNSATATDTNEPDLVTALGEQLGLRLESTRGPVQVTVFDRVERPTPN